MNTDALTLFAVLLTVFLFIATPWLGVWDFRRLMRRVREGRVDARIRAFRETILVQWLAVVVFLGWWLLDGGGSADIGLTPTAEGWQWLAIGLGLAAVLFTLFDMRRGLRNPDLLKKFRGDLGDLEALAPRDDQEAGLFSAVAVTAGICEEILYRGLLLTVLTAVIGLWPAVALSTLIFGLGHAYQGATGVLKTGAVGLVMALLTVFSGSIFVPILLHVVIDLAAGRLMTAAMTMEPEAV